LAVSIISLVVLLASVILIASTFISTEYTTLVRTKNTAVNFILHEFNESVFLLFSFFSGSA
ncbi:hypothetical protein D8Y09_11655, partial [Listeria ivanovii]|nr:hypothetical protein [Listeria ivanovii]